MTPLAESLVEQFHEGRYLSHLGDHQAANAILLGCVEAEPGDRDFVDGFLANLVDHYPAAHTAPIRQLPAGVSAAVARQDWRAVLRDGPRHLVTNPWNVTLLEALAEANVRQGEDDVALRYLALAIQAAPQDVTLLRQAGRIWARLRRYDRALEAWKQVEQLDPEDQDAGRMFGLLVIAASRQRGGVPSDCPELLGADPPRADRPARAAKPRILLRLDELSRTRTTPQAQPEIQRTPIQQLEAALRDHPTDVVLYLQLAPMYLDKGRDYDAEKLLAKGRSETDDEPRIRELWEDVTMQRLAKKIQQAQLRINIDSSDEARSDFTELCAKRDRLEIEFFVERLKRNPDDTALAYELGRRLRQAGQIRDAMRCFEQAVKHDDFKCAAAVELAECHLQVRELSAAFRYCRLAIDWAIRPQDSSAKSRALLRAAELAARLKLPVLARSYLDPLLHLDPQHAQANDLLRELA